MQQAKVRKQQLRSASKFGTVWRCCMPDEEDEDTEDDKDEDEWCALLPCCWRMHSP
jgi:hypothetical protein